MRNVHRPSFLSIVCFVAASLSMIAVDVRAGTTTFYALGDSITWGYGVAGGYRDPLFSQLEAAKFSPQFVGKSSGNATPLLNAQGQQFHDGHSGWRTFDIDNNVAGGIGFLSQDASNPTLGVDYILLMVGTNDLIAGDSAATVSANTRQLVDHITAMRPDAQLIIASVPPLYSTDLDNPADRLLQFNASLPGMAADFRADGRNVFFADQFSNFIDASGATYGLADGIHPDAAGYTRIADTWFSAIQAVPEPASLALFALPVALLAPRRRNVSI